MGGVTTVAVAGFDFAESGTKEFLEEDSKGRGASTCYAELVFEGGPEVELETDPVVCISLEEATT